MRLVTSIPRSDLLRQVLFAVGILLLGIGGDVFSFAQAQEIPVELKDVAIVEKLGTDIPIAEYTFKDELGQTVRLADYFQRGRPVLLNLVYYKCPNLCNFLLNGMVSSLKTLDWTPGQQFEMVTISIDPKEGFELAQQKKEAYLKEYARPSAASGWHFLTSEENQVQRLAAQLGFGYRYDQKEKQYAHGAVSFVLTPTGKVSRYLYGIEFSNKDLRLALLEASGGKVGTVVDRFLLFCYRYDPQTKKYSVYLTRLMQTAAVATVMIFGSYLAVFWCRQRNRSLT